MTADITFNMSTKKIISPYHKPHIFMETAFFAWVVERFLVPDEKTITSKALSLYDTFTETATNDNHGRNENDIKNLSPDNSVCTQRKQRFCAGQNWF